MKGSKNFLYDVLTVIGIVAVVYIVIKIIFNILTSTLFWIILIAVIIAYFMLRYKGKR